MYLKGWNTYLECVRLHVCFPALHKPDVVDHIHLVILAFRRKGKRIRSLRLSSIQDSNSDWVLRDLRLKKRTKERNEERKEEGRQKKKGKNEIKPRNHCGNYEK